MFHAPSLYEVFWTCAQLTYVEENQVAPSTSCIKHTLLGILSPSGTAKKNFFITFKPYDLANGKE
jgi:hypothetical protein